MEDQHEDRQEEMKEQHIEDSLARAQARVAELETALSSRDAEIGALTQGKAGLEAKVQALDHSLLEAVSEYRRLVLAANPGAPPEMIRGDSIEAIGDSLKHANDLIGRVKKGLEEEFARARVPAGAPGRGQGGGDLSAAEKIRQGIAR